MNRLLAATLFTAALLTAQSRNPVQWSVETEGATATIQAIMEPGWHIYALTTPAGGPTPTTIKLGDTKAATGLRLYQTKPIVKFDPNFNLNVEAFEGSPKFLAVIALAKDQPKGDVEIPLLVRYQACTDRECLPRKANLSAKFNIDPAQPPPEFVVPAGFTEFTGQRSGPLGAAPKTQSSDDQGLASFLLVAFGFGLAAIFTPCVFPMIPITLSFFLNKPGAVRQAILFCLGIVVIFMLGFSPDYVTWLMD